LARLYGSSRIMGHSLNYYIFNIAITGCVNALVPIDIRLATEHSYMDRAFVPKLKPIRVSKTRYITIKAPTAIYFAAINASESHGIAVLGLLPTQNSARL
jgi:hypothetical protein